MCIRDRFICSRRFVIYIVGIIVLAFGITLNTKTNLGVSPIISVAFCVSQLTNVQLGIVTFFWYCIMIALQAILLGKEFKLYQLLQVFASLLTSWFIGIFDVLLPAMESLPAKLILLVGAIVITAIGVVLTVGMNVVPNPADGLSSALGKKLGRDLGFGKNLFDFSSIVISLVIGFAFAGEMIGIGIGTVLTMILTGRVIAFINKRYLWWTKAYIQEN